MKTVFNYIFSSTLMFSAFTGNAQECNDWNWPENKALAEQKYALYTDAKKSGDFRLAANHLYWFLVNVPDFNKSSYINGAQIYEGLAELEKDPAKKRIYQDSSLLMYDLRIQYCNEKASVLNRKAFAAYQYFKNDEKEYKNLYELFKSAFELNGNNTWDNNLVAYMFITHKYKKAGGEISDEEVLDSYDKIIQIIDYKMKQGKNVDRLEKYKDNVDRLLTATVEVDCDFIENSLMPKLKDDPDDVSLAKKIFGLSLTAKCSDSPYFLETAKILQQKEPGYGIAYTIASKCLGKEDYDCANKYFKEAITLTEENEKIADIYYKLATIANINKNYSDARDLALKSVEADPSNKDGYNLIANLYMNSYNNCREGEDKVKDRLVFLAAYEMYKRAGNNEGMKNAEEQFPSKEELFERNYDQGQSMRVGCWINEMVVLKTRD